MVATINRLCFSLPKGRQSASSGVAPVPTSSGKTVRHRLNRRGNRNGNRALHVLALGWMSWDERTREYIARRTAEGKRETLDP